MQHLQDQNEGLKLDCEAYRKRISELTEKNKSLKSNIQKYQSTYHDIDIGELHRKLQYLESECDVMTRLNTRLTQHIDLISKNNDALRKKLKLLKERERRDKEAHEAALREAQEMEDARRGHMTSVVHAHDRTQ